MAADLAAGARAVLAGNWADGHTRPGPHLYPHQWSWDAALIAIGRAAAGDHGRARAELRSLFRGQWATGLVPHIVFAPDLPESAYFPGPGVWRTERAPGGPRGVATSGVVQPPVHATAVARLHEAAPDEAFLREMVPRLRAWHDYLHRTRDPGAEGLPAIRHPWESGQDNSPMWDDALAAAERVVSRPLPVMQDRVDLAIVSPDERPTIDDYDGYLGLVDWLRDHDYDEERIAGCEPFQVVDPLFSALLVRADRDLAGLEEALGGDGRALRERAERTAAALDARCWNEEQGLYLAYDRVAGRQVDAPAAAGLVPLFAGVPDAARAARLVAALDGDERFWPPAGRPVASFDRTRPQFDRARYWRGPAWVNIDWLLVDGLRRCGREADAERLRRATLAMVAGAGFFEYYDPLDGRGRGSPEFSWSAALVLDLLSDARRAS